MQRLINIVILSLFCVCASVASGQDAALIDGSEREPVSIDAVATILDGSFAGSDAQEILRELGIRGESPLGLINRISFSREQLWIKFAIDNIATAEQQVVIVADFPILNIQLLEASGKHAGRIQRSGVAVRNEAYPTSTRSAFAVTLAPGRSSFYMGFQPDGNPFPTQIKVWPEVGFREYENGRIQFMVAIFSAFVALFVAALLNGLVMRDAAYLWFFLGGVSTLVFLGTVNGFHAFLPDFWRQLFAKSWFMWLAISLIAPSMVIQRFFDVNILHWPRTYRFNQIFFALSVVAPALSILMPRAMLYLFLAVACGNYLNSAAVVARSYRRKRTEALIFLMSYVPIIGAVMPFALGIVGLIPNRVVYGEVLLCSTFVTMLLIAFGITTSHTKIEEAHTNLRNSLKGVISDELINRAIQSNVDFISKPTLARISIVFIDIVGYADILRTIEARDAFYLLKKILADLNAIVYRHGGVIDKTLVDGILCFFGYDLTGEKRPNHESAALSCAVEISKFAVDMMISEAEKVDGFQFPMRVGIHTDEVYIGNLGTAGRYDVTLSGDGVVLASRCRSAADPFKMIVSKATYEGLDAQLAASHGFGKILIPLKHRVDLVEAYEYNPFYDMPDVLRQAQTILWQRNKKQLQHPRLQPLRDVHFKTTHGPMTLMNVSLGGMALLATVQLARGVKLEMTFADDLAHEYGPLVNPLVAEVVWSTVNDLGTAQIGLTLVGVNAKERQLIFELMVHTMNESAAS
ncbi:MAG: hypothetical protein NTZ90_16010 [Proteobacteria bacterium]|nr:hypothetical protein [Pseudomonadota bacterium]